MNSCAKQGLKIMFFRENAPFFLLKTEFWNGSNMKRFVIFLRSFWLWCQGQMLTWSGEKSKKRIKNSNEFHFDWDVIDDGLNDATTWLHSRANRKYFVSWLVHDGFFVIFQFQAIRIFLYKIRKIVNFLPSKWSNHHDSFLI